MQESAWEYTVDPPAHGSREVRVRAEFSGSGTDQLAIEASAVASVRDLEVNGGDGWRPAPPVARGWRVAACRSHCAVRYSVDLGKVAAASDDSVDGAVRVGDATLSPALAWLLHPEPNGNASVVVRVHPPDAREFVTGLRSDPGRPWTYVFRSADLDEGAFTAFGPSRQGHLVVGGASIDVVLLGPPMRMSDAEVYAWVADAARVASSVHDRFPVPHAAVFVVPIKGEDDVVFGKVLALSGASVVVLVGDNLSAADTPHDWVLVHEFFHLGFPSFRGEGRWLEEGLATYYEPILRERAGWTTEAELWGRFAREMHRGLPAGPDERGLEKQVDLDAIYWGGALYALIADVRIRELSHGQHSLDEVLRATLARGGDATRVWRVSEVLRLGDETTGMTVLRDTYRRPAGARPVDLDGLLRSLGVEVDEAGGIALREDRPLSAVRRAISTGLRPGNVAGR